jgi:hypothetical protein
MLEPIDGRTMHVKRRELSTQGSPGSTPLIVPGVCAQLKGPRIRNSLLFTPLSSPVMNRNGQGHISKCNEAVSNIQRLRSRARTCVRPVSTTSLSITVNGRFRGSDRGYGWWIANIESYGEGSASFLEKVIGNAHRCR